MKLYCVRHCEANAVDVDSERGLSAQGLEDANKLGEHLRQQQIIIPEVLHSGKKRAEETAEILAKACEAENIIATPVLLDDMADVNVIVDMAKTWVSDTMLVGHMPFMANLVSALVMELTDNMQLVTYVPGTIVCLHLVDGGRWVIDWVLKPENLS